MPGIAHVNEVHDNEPAQVTQAQLPGKLCRCFHIGQENGFIEILVLGCAAGIYVYGHQRLCRVDHDRAAGWQLDYGLVYLLNLVFNSILVENRP